MWWGRAQHGHFSPGRQGKAELCTVRSEGRGVRSEKPGRLSVSSSDVHLDVRTLVDHFGPFSPMSPRFLSFLPIAVFGLIGATSNGVAQELPFTVEFHDTTGYVMPMNVVDLKAWVRNISPGEVPIRLARTQNLLPTSNWF